jgi:hypothetical protein
MPADRISSHRIKKKERRRRRRRQDPIFSAPAIRAADLDTNDNAPRMPGSKNRSKPQQLGTRMEQNLARRGGERAVNSEAGRTS